MAISALLMALPTGAIPRFPWYHMSEVSYDNFQKPAAVEQFLPILQELEQTAAHVLYKRQAMKTKENASKSIQNLITSVLNIKES